LFENVTELGVLFVGPHGRVLDANRGAELLLDWPAGEIIHAEVSTVLEFDPAALHEPNVQRHFGTETLCRRRDGSRFWADVVIAPIRAASGTITDYVLLLRDVSRRKREHERERRRMEQSAAVAAFAQRATREMAPEAVVEAAVEHLAAAMQVDYTEVLTPNAEDARLSSTHVFAWQGPPEPGVAVDPAGTIYAEALAQREPVVRELHPADYAAAPHLRSLGVRWGAVIAIAMGDAISTMGAFSQTTISDSDIYPLQSIAAMSEAIIARRRAERHSAERDRTLTMILEQMPAILTTIDRDLRFTSIQGAGLRLLSGRRDTANLNVLDVTPPGSQAHVAMEGALRGESASYIGEYRDRLYENRVEPLRTTEGEIVGAVNLGIDITERRRDEEALRASREELRRLSARLNKLQEEERRRIAHELHDELGQRLTALRIEAALLPHKLGPHGTRAASDAIESMIALIDETIVTVRRVATELRPPILDDFGFRAALEIELAGLQKRSGVEHSIHFSPPDLEIDREHATTLYRIVQESLTNVARHAGATFVSVSVELRGESIVLEIADNGRGISPDEVSHTSSLGIIGIRERAVAHGGNADVRRGAAGGTVVSVQLPAIGAAP
jgi:PAS domain S-box-containing protein